MHGIGLLADCKITKVSGAVAAGTSSVNSSEIDMTGFEGVVFIGQYGTSAADNGLKAQQDTATGMASAADLEGTSVLLDGTETLSIVQVHKPREQFVRAVAVRGTSSTLDSIIAIQYGPRTAAVDNNASTDNAAESHVSPAEGTA